MYGNAKAIETVYNGYKFRSRLEARWAVFFDSLGVVYEYEPEGFDLTEVAESKKPIYYLPDFYLPELDCFVEVKGKKPTLEEIRKCIMLRQATEKDVILLWGVIGCPTGYEASTAHYVFKDGFWADQWGWMECPECKEVGFGKLLSELDQYNCEKCGEWIIYDSPRLQDAYRKAKQSRFEFDFRARVIQ